MSENTLNSLDYRILKFFKDNPSVSIDDAQNTLADISAIEYRIKILAAMKYNPSTHSYSSSSSYLKEDYEKVKFDLCTGYNGLGTYQITDLGLSALQNYEVAENQRKKDLWLVNAKIPIAVSLITTLAVNLLPKMLLLIVQLLAGSP